MDYRNADGSLSEMCGNGIRVFAPAPRRRGPGRPGRAGADRHPRRHQDADRRRATARSPSTWARPRLLGRDARSRVGDRSWPATHVDMGNPHAVAFVDVLDDAGALLTAPAYDAGDLPARRQRRVRGPPRARHVAMRVHERGVGRDPLLRHRCLRGDGRRRGRRRVRRPPAEDVAYRVDVPGGTPHGHLDRRRPGAAQRPGRHRGEGHHRPLRVYDPGIGRGCARRSPTNHGGARCPTSTHPRATTRKGRPTAAARKGRHGNQGGPQATRAATSTATVRHQGGNQGQPPYGAPQGQPPYGNQGPYGAPQGRPPYGQPGYPQQGYGGPQGPGGPGGPGGPWGPGPGGPEGPHGSGGNKRGLLIGGAVLAVLLVIGGIAGAVALTGGDDDSGSGPGAPARPPTRA